MPSTPNDEKEAWTSTIQDGILTALDLKPLPKPQPQGIHPASNRPLYDGMHLRTFREGSGVSRAELAAVLRRSAQALGIYEKPGLEGREEKVLGAYFRGIEKAARMRASRIARARREYLAAVGK